MYVAPDVYIKRHAFQLFNAFIRSRTTGTFSLFFSELPNLNNNAGRTVWRLYYNNNNVPFIRTPRTTAYYCARYITIRIGTYTLHVRTAMCVYYVYYIVNKSVSWVCGEYTRGARSRRTVPGQSVYIAWWINCVTRPLYYVFYVFNSSLSNVRGVYNAARSA